MPKPVPYKQRIGQGEVLAYIYRYLSRAEYLMTSEVVNLQVTASIPIDCDFWSEDDGWKGLCKSLSVTAGGGSFEDAKKTMATELQAYIERILREHPKRSANLFVS